MEDNRVNDLLDWYRINLEEGYFTGSGGGPVRFAIQRKKRPAGTLVMVPGRAEFLEKYIELCRDLQDCPSTICLLDHFGQGGSGRPLDDRQKGHIDDFKYYVEDLLFLLSSPDIIDGAAPVVILAHSMGATVSTLLAAEHPRLVHALLLVSPMLQINTGVLLPPILAEMISVIACRLGKTEDYVFGGGPFDPALPFAGNVLTSDPVRFRRNLRFVQQDARLALGSPTFGWLHQAYRAMRKARRRAGAVRCPVLLFQGTDDRVVGLPAMDSFCNNTDSGDIIRCPGGRHELLMERDELRTPLIDRLRTYLEMVSTVST